MMICYCNSYSYSQILKIAIFVSQINLLASGLSFSFTRFDVGDSNMSYEGAAFPADQAIQLTKNLMNADTNLNFGRATYHKSMQLWDKGFLNLTDFETHFTFVINSQNRIRYGDGLTFFLAPEGSKLPPNETQGSSLGLTSDDQQLNTTVNRFVAVEFDTFKNYFDPLHEHVGININSMKSVNNITWICDIRGGKRSDAWISYNSSTYNLSVVFSTDFGNNNRTMQSLSQIVDLRDYLPEKVTFGFSGSTGNLSATHSILSWNFSSTLETNEIVGVPTEPPSLAPKSNPNGNGKNRTGLAVGLGVAGALVGLACLFWLVNACWKKYADDKEGVPVLEEYMNDEFQKGTGPKKFIYSELARATDNFKDENKLGEGGFGGVHKGFLRDTNSYIAVKRVSRESKQGIKEYAAEVKIISQLRHRNLVQLLGWCHERNELLLVYEFMPNGSLDC